MVNRKRKIQKIIRVSEDENGDLQQRISMAGNPKFEPYARQALLQNAILQLDFSEWHELNLQIARIGNNINQIARIANTNESFNDERLNQLRAAVSELFSALGDEVLHRADLINKYRETLSGGDLKSM